MSNTAGRLTQVVHHLETATKTVTEALTGKSTAKMPKIERITMFKIPNPEDRKTLLEHYKKLHATAQKDGKPYILSLAVGEAGPDPRSQGWHIASKSTFASKEDMDYYDKDCEAHKVLKAFVGPVKEDVMTVWYESAVEGSI